MISGIEIYDRTGSQRLSVITTEVENPEYTHISPGGYGTLTFDLKRDPKLRYIDIALMNIVRVYIPGRRRPVWEGEITNLPRRMSVNPADRGVSVEASGCVSWMRSRVVTAPFASGKISTWISSHMLGDLGYVWASGSPHPTGEFSFPEGIDVSQHRRYYELIEDANATMGWDWGVGLMEGGKPQFYFEPYSQTPDYYVDYEDCESDMDYSVDGVENVIRYRYTDLDEIEHEGWYPNDGNPTHAVPDADSVALYRRRDGEFERTEPTSSTVINAMLAQQHDERKVLRPASSLTTSKVYGSDGLTVIPVEECESGKVLFIRGLFPASLTRDESMRVNELSTFRVVETKVISHEGIVEFAPASCASTLAEMLARVDALRQK